MLRASSICGVLLYIAQCHTVLVDVSEGTLRGSVRQTQVLNNTYYSFEGIPYAKPPVGPLRFMPPQPPEPWNGIRNATEHGSICPQMEIVSQIYIPSSENCVFLNIYTPHLHPTKRYSVLFFIHGGGFNSGFGDRNMYGPDFFIDKYVIVVTINYRLDCLGFLSLENEKVSGNMGLKDQVAALKWVNKNIENFGGDRKSITIMGQSAGASAVGLHLISPMSKGLYQRAILMSGAPTSDLTVTYKPLSLARRLSKLLGNDTTEPNEILKFLQGVEVKKLIDEDAIIPGSETKVRKYIMDLFLFTPVIEPDLGQERFLTMDPLKAYMNGDVHDVDIMFGHTSMESVAMTPLLIEFMIKEMNSNPEVWVPKKILLNTTRDMAMKIANLTREYYFGNKSISVANLDKVIKYTSDYYYVAPTAKLFSHMRARKDKHMYSYVFSSYSNRNIFGREGAAYNLYGAGHMDEIPYMFYPYGRNLTIDLHSKEYVFVNLTTSIFANFIKYGNPTPDSSLNITWPEYDNINKRYVNIVNDKLIVGTNPDGDTVEFYESIYKLVGMSF